MAIDYKCLGRNSTTQNRRYEILKWILKGYTPAEIQKITGNDIKEVYNDIQFLHKTPLHNVPVELMKDMGQSFFEVKIKELEENLDTLDAHSKLWLETQALIIKTKTELLKLQGGYVEKVEHTITEPIQIIWPKQSNE